MKNILNMGLSARKNRILLSLVVFWKIGDYAELLYFLGSFKPAGGPVCLIFPRKGQTIPCIIDA